MQPASLKLARLPFLFVFESCGGHFYKDQYRKHETSIRKARKGQLLYHTGPYFDLALDNSKEARLFRATLQEHFGRAEFRNRVRIIPDVGRGLNQLIVKLGPGPANLYARVKKEGARRVAGEEQARLEEFEKIIGQFLARQRAGIRKKKK